MTNQQAFDGVWKRLVIEVDKGKCFNPFNGECIYMDIKGNKCAIGALMPDDLCELSDNYAAEMVGTGIRGVATRIIQIREFFDGVDINLLSAMQEIHDNHYGTQASNRLKEIAKKWNLTIPT